MPGEQKPRRPEINFLPPLEMILSFFKKKDRVIVNAEKPQESEEVKDEVKRIIEHIHQDDAANKK
jgi:hypothetical protein